MICSVCNGLVVWRGQLSNLTHTECEDCGAQNSQQVDGAKDDDIYCDCGAVHSGEEIDSGRCACCGKEVAP